MSCQSYDDTLCRIFAATLSADRSIRESAEQALYQASADVYLPCILLRFAASPSSAEQEQVCLALPTSVHNVKLAASIRLRNVVGKSDWNRSAYFQAETKGAIRNEIVGLCCGVHVDEAIRKQLMATVSAIMDYDFPNQWSDLTTQVQSIISHASASAMEGSIAAIVAMRVALEVLHKACKHYEDVTVVEPAQIEAFASVFVMPLLQLTTSITNSLTQNLSGSYFYAAAANDPMRRDAMSELLHAARLCWKALWSLSAQTWPRGLCDAAAASQTFSLLLQSMEAVNKVIAPLSIRECCPDAANSLQCLQRVAAWRYTKWIVKHFHRLMANMGVSPKATERRARPAAALLSETFAASFVQACITLMRWHHHADGDVHITSKAFIYAAECVEISVAHKDAYLTVILPCAESLLCSVLFERFQFSDEDLELWNYNPEEYVRKQTDPRGDLFNPKLVSAGLVVTLCCPQKSFHSKELMPSFVQFVLQRLGTLLPQLTAPTFNVNDAASNACAVRYDACLFALGQMKKVLERSSALDHGTLEWVLTTYVAPALRSPVGFLRAKSVFVLSLFCNIEWSSMDVFAAVVNAVVGLLSDPDLPVRIQTCTCLSRFVRHEAAKAVLTPQIGNIIQSYFFIMRQMDNDGVVRTLRKTIKFYGDTVSQWAVTLCRMLVEHFMTLHEQLLRNQKDIDVEGGGGEDGEGEERNAEDDVVDSLLAADELIETLRTLIQAVPAHQVATDGSPRMMSEIQTAATPMLHAIMSLRHGSSMGFMDGALHLLTTILSHSDEVTPSMWTLMPCLYRIAMDGSFMDYVENLVPPIDNFASVDPTGFFANALSLDETGQQTLTGAQMVLQMCTFLSTNASSSHHLAAISKLVDVVTLQQFACPGASSHMTEVGALLQLSLQVLTTRAASLPPTVQVLYADNVMLGVYCSPSTTVRLLEATQAASFIMDAMAQLFMSTKVRDHLRPFDRRAFVAMIVRFVQIAGDARNECQQLCASLAQQLVGHASGFLTQLALDELRLLQGELKYHEKRANAAGGSGYDSDDDDSGYDEDEETDSDDNNELEFDEDGEDFGEEDLEEAMEGADITSHSQFADTLIKAKKMREALDDDDTGFDDVNYLDDDDFVTPLDNVDMWGELCAACTVASNVVPVGPELAQIATQTSEAWRRCQELRAKDQ